MTEGSLLKSAKPCVMSASFPLHVLPAVSTHASTSCAACCQLVSASTLSHVCETVCSTMLGLTWRICCCRMKPRICSLRRSSKQQQQQLRRTLMSTRTSTRGSLHCAGCIMKVTECWWCCTPPLHVGPAGHSSQSSAKLLMSMRKRCAHCQMAMHHNSAANDMMCECQADSI